MKQYKKYSGVIIPAVTPLTAGHQLDQAAVQRLFGLFYRHGAVPFILGTTGEAASLPIELKQEYVRVAVQNKEPGTLLYAGIGSNVPEESTRFAEFCAQQGVDVLVAVLPSYYTLTEKQMLRYFLSLADSSPLPLFIYNIPATTHMSIPLGVVDELSAHKNIAGIKDSERSDERMQQSLALWKDREDFHYILGWAAKSAEALISGADGLVPSTGNLYPEIYAAMLTSQALGDFAAMSEMQRLSDEYGARYQSGRTLGESLHALKLLMKEKGICEEYVMPPL